MSLSGLRPGASRIAYSGRRVLKNTISQVLTFGLAMATGGIAAILVARGLGPDGLGVFMPAWQLAISLSIVALLGIDQWAIRELNRGGSTDDLEHALTLSAVLGIVFGGVAALAPAMAGMSPGLVRAFAAAGGYVALSAPALVLRFSFHARERMEVETFTIVAETVVALVGVPLTLALGGDAAWVIVALAGARLVNLVMSAGFARRLWGRVRPTVRPGRWPTILKASLPLGVSFSFTTMVLRFDVVLVGVLLTPREAGVYSAAAVVTFAIPMVVTSLNRSLYPVLARARTLDHPELRQVFSGAWRLLLVSGLTMAAGLAVLAGPAVELVFGTGFEDSARVLAVLATLLPVRLVNNLCATTLNATVWRRRQAVVFGTVIAANLLANVTLIPLVGYWGAVYAALGTEAVLLAVLLHAVRPVGIRAVRPLTEAAVVALAASGTAAIVPGHVVLRATAGGLVFVVLVAGIELVGRRRERSEVDLSGASGRSRRG